MSLTCGHHTTLREGIDPVPMLEANCLLLCGPREPQAARSVSARGGRDVGLRLGGEDARHRCHGKRSQTVPTDVPLQADVRCDGEVQARARRPACGSGRRAQASRQDVHRLRCFDSNQRCGAALRAREHT